MALTVIVSDAVLLEISAPHTYESNVHGIYVAQVQFAEMVAPDTLDITLDVYNFGWFPTHAVTLDPTTDPLIWTAPPIPAEVGYRLNIVQMSGTPITVRYIIWDLLE